MYKRQGKEFLDGADWLRKTKPLKYRHMYLGELVGLSLIHISEIH